MPRFRIAWVMVAVAIAAFDFGAIRAMFGSWGHSLLLGALPMANVLAVGILVGQQRPGSRPFLLGFEVFGAMALAFYVVAYAWFFPKSHELVDSYLAPWLELMEKAIGRSSCTVWATQEPAGVSQELRLAGHKLSGKRIT